MPVILRISSLLPEWLHFMGETAWVFLNASAQGTPTSSTLPHTRHRLCASGALSDLASARDQRGPGFDTPGSSHAQYCTPKQRPFHLGAH